jgi:hypothetical protein
MKRVFFFTLLASLIAFSSDLYAGTVFFGSIDSSITSNDNLEDAQSDINDSRNYMDTKLTLGIENDFNGYLKGVALFEAGSIIWGIDGENYPSGKSTGGGPSGDGINVETKNIYLDISAPESPVNFKCGLMPFSIADGVIAGDDAFGFRLSMGSDFNAVLNVIRVYQESMGTKFNLNEDDPDRREDFIDLEMSNRFNDNISANLLFGYLADRYNGAKGSEIDRDVYYVGAGITGNATSAGVSLNYIYNTGGIEHSDVIGNTPVDIDLSGYMVDFSGHADFGGVSLLLQYLYASGDDSFTADKNEGFIVPETSYKTDIAEILTRGELSGELEGDEDYEAYQYIPGFNNIYFIKGKAGYQINKKTSISLAVVYAALPEEKSINPAGVIKAHKVGMEYDLKLSRVIYTADDQKKGLRLDIIAASGDVFNEYIVATDTIKEASSIQEFGARLVYEF